MSHGSAGTTLTSKDFTELERDVSYHLHKIEQILSKIATNRGNVRVAEWSRRTKEIRLDIEEYVSSIVGERKGRQ